MELLRLEHKKLWHRKSVQIGVLLCFLYIIIFGNLLSYQWFTFGSTDDFTSSFGNRFDGYSNIRKKQEYANNWKALNAWIQTLWPELEEADQPYIMLSYVDPSQLTDFEERRKKALEDFLDMNGQTGEEKEYFLNMNAKADTPLQYRWTEGWTFVTADFVSQCGVVLAIFLAIGIAPMFCGEWHDHTKALIATTKNGRKKIAGVKVMAALGYTGIVLLCSALTRSNYVSLLISLGIVFVPMAVSQFLPLWGQKLLDIIPFVGNATDIFQTNMYHLFGLRIWSPYLLITVPISVGVISLPFAVHFWAKRAKI